MRVLFHMRIKLHNFVLLSRDYYASFMNGVFDAKKNSSEAVNQAMIQYFAQQRFMVRAIYEYKLDHGHKKIKRKQIPKKQYEHKYWQILHLLNGEEELMNNS